MGAGCMTAGQVLRQHMSALMDFEQSEILEYQNIYYFGAGSEKIKATPVAGGALGFAAESGPG